MKPTKEKTLLFIMIAVGVACAAGLIVFVVLAPKTGDKRLDALLLSTVPELFAAVFITVVAVIKFRPLLAPKKPSLNVLLWSLPCLAVAVVNFPFSALASGTGTVERFDLLWLFIIKCILIGITEEFLFRGILVSSLSDTFKGRHGVFLTVLVSSAVFSLFHFINLASGSAFIPVLMQVGYSFLIGAMLATLYIKTGGLWLCVIIHALFDFGGYIISDLGTGSPHDTVFWILTAIVGALTAVHVIYTIIVLDKRRAAERA